LRAVNEVTGGTPALGELGAVVGVGCQRRRAAQSDGGDNQDLGQSEKRMHPVLSFDLISATPFAASALDFGQAAGLFSRQRPSSGW
jgi:hypothetical protein